MNQNNSLVANASNAENLTLSREFIFKKVFVWGVENHRIPIFRTWKDEKEHFGKYICEFSDKELKYYDQAMDKLERHFEGDGSAIPSAHLGL